MTGGLRIGVDATSWANRRGYGRFVRNAVGRLVEADAETTYVLYIDADTADDAELPHRSQPRRIALTRPPSRAAAADSHRRVSDLFRLTVAVSKDRLDAFLFPSLYTYFPLLRTPLILGVHDVIADEFPELTLPTRKARALWRAKEALAVRQATILFTVSEASRSAVADRFGIAPEQIATVPEAPDPVFFPRAPAHAAGELAAVGLRPAEPFFLFAGGISPHKNIETLIEAYGMLRTARQGPLPRLVLVGELERDPFLSAASSVRARIANLGLEQDVDLPGFVSDEALAALYSAATAVVLPSLAEGFGLPAVEAAACGAPMILSDLPAHRETLGEAALYFRATEVPELARALGRVLDDEALRRSLGERSRLAVSSLSWDEAAARLHELVVDAARRR